MGLTQSAMSSALGRLRRQLGDPLFVNTRSGMLPTPRALELAPAVTDALAMVRGALGSREAFDPRRTTRTPPRLHDGRRRDGPAAEADAPSARAQPGDPAGDGAAAGGRAGGAARDRRHRPRGGIRAAAARQGPPHAPLRGALRVHDAAGPSARPARAPHAQGVPGGAPRPHLLDGLGPSGARAHARRARRGGERGAARAALRGGAADRRRHRPDRQPAEPRRRGLGAAGEGQGASAADPDPELRRLPLLARARGERRGEPVAARRDAGAVRRPAAPQMRRSGA